MKSIINTQKIGINRLIDWNVLKKIEIKKSFFGKENIRKIIRIMKYQLKLFSASLF